MAYDTTDFVGRRAAYLLSMMQNLVKARRRGMEIWMGAIALPAGVERHHELRIYVYKT